MDEYGGLQFGGSYWRLGLFMGHGQTWPRLVDFLPHLLATPRNMDTLQKFYLLLPTRLFYRFLFTLWSYIMGCNSRFPLRSNHCAFACFWRVFIAFVG